MTTRFVPLAVVAFAMATPAFAHHGWGGYQDAVSEVSGTVERLSLSGAHASMKLRSADGTTWDVVLSPPYMTVSAGIKSTTIPVGAMVTAQGHRHRDESRLELKTEQLKMGPRTFDIYPGRRD